MAPSYPSQCHAEKLFPFSEVSFLITFVCVSLYCGVFGCVCVCICFSYPLTLAHPAPASVAQSTSLLSGSHSTEGLRQLSSRPGPGPSQGQSGFSLAQSATYHRSKHPHLALHISYNTKFGVDSICFLNLPHLNGIDPSPVKHH